MIKSKKLIQDLNLIREKSPLVHNITNYVVMNTSANALLAIGASPVMAHAKEEVAEMVSLASSLVINIGTLDSNQVESMLLAGKTANEKNIPVIFDPVGTGATSYRKIIAKQIIDECKPAIIRGNASEILALSNVPTQTKGVDSTDSSVSALKTAKLLAMQTGAIVVISGAVDYITNGEIVESVNKGNPIMARVTGMGCTATALMGAFASINKNYFQAATHTMLVMGISGEIAATKSSGNGSMQMNFLDTLYSLNEQIIENNLRTVQ